MELSADTMAAAPRASRPPSLLACIACRRQHLKCNAQMPVCSRCQRKNIECVYTQSKRGFRGLRKTSRAIKTPSDTSVSEYNSIKSHDTPGGTDNNYFNRPLGPSPDFNDHTTVELGGATRLASSPRLGLELPEELGGSKNMLKAMTVMPYAAGLSSGPVFDSNTSSIVPPIGSYTSIRGQTIPAPPHLEVSENIADPLIDAFYTFFHPAHPWIIPRKMYVQNPTILPAYLQKIIRFVGSHFIPGSTSESLRNSAASILFDAVPQDGHTVQALFLLAMALFARFEQRQAAECLDKAITLALQLGMNRKEFSVRRGQGIHIMEESWRRSWWDLYIVDGFVSAMDGFDWPSRLRDMPSDVPLPGECQDYNHCLPVRPSKTLFEMQNRAFAEDDFAWSSFAYAVEAMRIMHTVRQSGTEDPTSDHSTIEAIDASLSGFMLSLPSHKRDLVERSGRVDELLFTAQLTIHWASILLHRPRSELAFTAGSYQTSCNADNEFVTRAPVLAFASHASKALSAANEISKMTSLRTPLSMHTPCYICGIALGAVVHLPGYVLETCPQAAGTIKERLQLAINALNILSEVWPMARVVKSQVAQYAREALASPRRMPPNPASAPLLGQIDLAAFDDDSWLEDLNRIDSASVMAFDFAMAPGQPSNASVA